MTNNIRVGNELISSSLQDRIHGADDYLLTEIFRPLILSYRAPNTERQTNLSKFLKYVHALTKYLSKLPNLSY